MGSSYCYRQLSYELLCPRNSSVTRIMVKENNKAIEIYGLDSQAFALQYVYNYLTLEDIRDANINLSKITILELSNCNLTDLPASCYNLNLKYLGLSHNDFERVPSCLYSGLRNLESLDLSFNSIENFDLEPDCLSCIRKLNLSNNKFANAPKWFLMFRCTNLEEFNYSNNKAKNYKFWRNSFNLKLLKLKKLELVSSCLIDNDFNLLKSFKELQYLDIGNDNSHYINRFDDLDVLFVKPKWIDINILKLNNLCLSIFPEGIAWMESLKELHASNNCLSWLPDSIKYLVNLEVLVVSNNTLVSLPRTLVSLVNLTVLQASNNYIEAVPIFSCMTNLETLDLYNNSLDYKIGFDMDTVTYIDLEGNYHDTREFENYCLYEEKKNNLRKKYSVDDRCDGPKIKKSEDIIDSCSDVDVDYDLTNEIKNTLTTFDTVDPNEIWDFPPKISKTNPEIDTEDEDWQGQEETKTCLKSSYETKRVYVSEDDWMFEDCDDDVWHRRQRKTFFQYMYKTKIVDISDIVDASEDKMFKDCD